MTTSTQWQLAHEAAERYQNILTPAILGPFARALVDAAGLRESERVADIGCGTGEGTRYAAEKVGRSGWVAGVDINAAMLAVARSLPAGPGATIEWHEAPAARLPLADQSVDVVLCAQTLQFLPDKEASLAEMRRVTGPTGRIAISLWSHMEDNPYFHALVDSVAGHLGPETAAGLRSVFNLSDAADIHSLLQEVGFRQIDMAVIQLDLPLPQLTSFIPRHISATPMAAGFDQAPAPVQRQIIEEVSELLSPFASNGQTQIPFRSQVIRLH